MKPSPALPLVVDLDGTLTPADTLYESLIPYLKQAPLRLLRLPFALRRGIAACKQEIASLSPLDPAQLPYRQDLLDYLHAEKAKGRSLVLATAAHATIAHRVARHLPLFDQVLATEHGRNRKGLAKLELIRTHVGEAFVYAGDSPADLPIWQAATAAVLVHVDARTAAAVRRTTAIEREFPPEPLPLTVWLRALRVHQWLKNLLLFVPLLTSFSLRDFDKFLTLGVAFLAFSLAAAGTYLLNDLWDLESDRHHPRKRRRAFAAALLPIPHGLLAAAFALAAALLLSALVSPGFLAMLLLYVGLTSAYSWKLKAHVLVDVLLLSLLYTLRILAGSVAVHIPASSWLLAFSAFSFLSLALVKRCAELVSLQAEGRETTNGRDYRVSDLAVLWPMGVGAALSAVVVYGLFISAPETQVRYASPQMLWLVAIALTYWFGRLWVKTSRGEMHDDPVVYAIKDRGSRIAILAILTVMLVAHAAPWSPPR
jgi:4-hydroxybenzoate polyprenyltransferase